MATAKRYRKDGGMRAASCCSDNSSSHCQNEGLFVHRPAQAGTCQKGRASDHRYQTVGLTQTPSLQMSPATIDYQARWQESNLLEVS